MEHNQKIEVFGNLSKIEIVKPIEEIIVPGSLVFESLNPFPGYYHETPGNRLPIYLYLVLDQPYPLERILRATQNIEGEHGWNFDAGKGYMELVSHELHVIRLRHLPNYGIVQELQEAYEEQGIKFLRKSKKPGQETVRVKIVKFLSLERIAEGIYLDLKEKNHAYIEIPKYIDRDTFSQISKEVRYNWEGHEFDAAIGSFFHTSKLHEFVRIYSNQLSVKYLEKIKEMYIHRIK